MKPAPITEVKEGFKTIICNCKIILGCLIYRCECLLNGFTSYRGDILSSRNIY